MRILPVLALLALAGIAYVAWTSSDRSARVAPREERGPLDGRTEAPGPVLELPASPVVRVTAPSSEPASRASEPAGPERETPERIVRGTIRVVDEEGAWHEREDGRVEIDGASVDVTEGAFELSARATDELRIGDVFLGDRLAWIDAEERTIQLPRDGVVVLRSRWTRTTTVHVLAADSDRLLTRVQAFEDAVGSGLLPDERQVASTPLVDAPVQLAATGTGGDGRRTFLLRAPGYAWQRIEIDLLAGGERTLRLARCGGIEAKVAGNKWIHGAFLRLRPVGADGPIEAELELPGLPASGSWYSLPPGPWRVCLDWGEPGMLDTIAEVEVQVAPDEMTRVTLRPWLDEPVPCAGTLRLPRSWGVARPSLRIGDLSGEEDDLPPIEHLELVAGHADLWSWRANDVVPGRYELAFDPAGLVTVVDVPPRGRTDAFIDVPPPAEVEIRVIERRSAAPVSVHGLTWSAPRGASASGPSVRATWDEARNAWTFRAPEGAIDVSDFDMVFDGATRRFEVRPGANRFTYEVGRTCGIALRLLDGETMMPWPWDLHAKATAIDHDGRQAGMSIRTDRFLCRVSEPGRYRIELGDVPGYTLTEPLDLEVPAETWVEQGILLVRRP